MKMSKGIMGKMLLGLLLIVMFSTPRQVLAESVQTQSMELINNRSEIVWVAYRTWDFAKQDHWTRGWFRVNPSSRITITGLFGQQVSLYAKSKTQVWEGGPLDHITDDIGVEVVVRTDAKFEYWGWGEREWQENWKDRKRCIFFFVKMNAETENFTYTFE